MSTTELRKEIRGMLKKDPKVKEYISKFEQFTGLRYSGRLTVEQLNDLIIWCTNEQISAERNYRKSLGGII